jgi:nitrite reductase/ring-hydroxylating ferredoxin subunit
MMTQEENARLTQTGRGTPCGEMMRRFWQPAALSAELASDKPLPVTLLGEELVLFRDGEGKPALIGRYCAHQGVDMIYGRVEEDGIRCMYHGWLFDACGKVIVRGAWVEGGEKRMEVGQPAYPCAEISGVILTYMGPGETPGLPVHELLANPSAGVAITKVLRTDNFLQGVLGPPLDGAKFVAPNLVAYAESPSGGEICVRWHVPVDDASHVEFTLRYLGNSPITGDPVGLARQVLLKEMEETALSGARRDQP